MIAFVTDGDQRPALAITRSLGRQGIAVVVGEERRHSLASTSRYSTHHVTYPSPYTAPEAFRRFLLEFVEENRIDVVVPVTDVTTFEVARDQDIIRRHTGTAVPPFQAFELVRDKWSVLQRARACGMSTPRTEFVENGRALESVIGRVTYPAVIKPVRSRTLTDCGWQPAIVHYAESADDLRRAYRSIEYLAVHPSLIQERILGPGTGLFVLCDRGRLLTAFAHRRLREKPPSGGASVLSESIPADPELVEQAMRLLGPIQWHGVAMLEYKRDSRRGRPFLMEVNGRFWGSLQLAIDAGVDFPMMACALAMGQPVQVPQQYQTGVKNRWLLGDLDHLLLRLFHSGVDLPKRAPSRLQVIGDFLTFRHARLHYDVFCRGDEAPARYELAAYVKALFTSARERRRKRALRSRAAPQLRPAAVSHPHPPRPR